MMSTKVRYMACVMRANHQASGARAAIDDPPFTVRRRPWYAQLRHHWSPSLLSKLVGNSLRSLIALAMIMAGLIIGSAAPVAAATPYPAGSSMIARPLECYRNGASYPLGTRIAAPSFGYLQCELLINQINPHTLVGWVLHLT